MTPLILAGVSAGREELSWGGHNGSTWLLFHSKKVAGGALPKEGKTGLMLSPGESPPSERSVTQTRCQNQECDRAQTCFQPIAPAEVQPVGKGTAANPAALQAPGLSWHVVLLLRHVFIFCTEQILSVKITPVAKRTEKSNSSKFP